jgi:hypothetical protein
MGDTFTAEVRKVETEIVETGVGQQNRIDVTYEIGATIDGAWVRFASVPGSTVETLTARARDARPTDPEGPMMQEVTPTPQPQQQASATEQGAAI